MKIAINGFGRIGRCLLRAIFELKHKDIDIVAINGPASLDKQIHLLKYDSVHGKFPFSVKEGQDSIIVDGKEIIFFHERKIENLDWKGIDIVLECTGQFNDAKLAKKHLNQGAKKVIVSAPCKDSDATIVFGVNNDFIKSDMNIISVGSCTTNCLAPIASILQNELGIEEGFVTTIHAYTNDQRILDSSHADLRRARACGLSLIPTKTGAAKSIGLVIPELEGKLDGSAIRVPTPNVSLIDFNFSSKKATSADEINKLMKKQIKENFKGIVDIAEDPLVSSDFIHDSHSAIFDPLETKVVNKKFVRVLAWYDNEWGFANRMLDVAKLFYSK